jgi:hypothetical protein
LLFIPAGAVAGLPALSSLSLTYFELEGDAVSQLASCSSSLTSLQLLQCEIDKYDACELLQSFSNLQDLQLSPLVTLPSNCHSSWGLEDLRPQGFRTVRDSLLWLCRLDLKGADVSRGLLFQLAEITQLRRLRIDMSNVSSVDHPGSGSSREQAEYVGSHIRSSSSSSVRTLPSSTAAATVDQGLTGADLQVLTQLSSLSHLVFKLRPCCHPNQLQQQQTHAAVCQEPSSSASAVPAAAAAAAAVANKCSRAAVTAICQLRSLSVLELGNLGLGVLQLWQLSQLSGLQHVSYTGCCQHPASSSWSVQLSAPQMQQVSVLDGTLYE